MNRRELLGTSLAASLAAVIGVSEATAAAPSPHLSALPKRRYPDGWADALVGQRIFRVERRHYPGILDDDEVQITMLPIPAEALDRAGVVRVDVYSALVDPVRPQHLVSAIPLTDQYLALRLTRDWARPRYVIATDHDQTRLLRLVARREDDSIAGQWGFFSRPLSPNRSSFGIPVPVEDGFGPYGTLPKR